MRSVGSGSGRDPLRAPPEDCRATTIVTDGVGGLSQSESRKDMERRSLRAAAAVMAR
jgi:hypothetical protein